jgi:hypothetical protein
MLILGVEAYAILRGAMNQRASPASRDCVNSRIRSTRNYEGVMTKISIDADGNVIRPVFINSIEDVSLSFVVKVY